MNHHWIMTIQNGMAQHTLSGDVDVDPGATRSEVYDGIYERALASSRFGKAIVLFFSLEPNELGG